MAASAVVVGNELHFGFRLGRAACLITVLVGMYVVAKVADILAAFVLAIGRCHRVAKLQRQDQEQQDVQQSAHESGLGAKTGPGPALTRQTDFALKLNYWITRKAGLSRYKLASFHSKPVVLALCSSCPVRGKQACDDPKYACWTESSLRKYYEFVTFTSVR